MSALPSGTSLRIWAGIVGVLTCIALVVAIMAAVAWVIVVAIGILGVGAIIWLLMRQGHSDAG